jgi:hypothetical protein
MTSKPGMIPEQTQLINDCAKEGRRARLTMPQNRPEVRGCQTTPALHKIGLGNGASRRQVDPAKLEPLEPGLQIGLQIGLGRRCCDHHDARRRAHRQPLVELPFIALIHCIKTHQNAAPTRPGDPSSLPECLTNHHSCVETRT